MFKRLKTKTFTFLYAREATGNVFLALADTFGLGCLWLIWELIPNIQNNNNK